MSDLGKIDRSFFERVIAARLGADRADVHVGPQHGIDFGVVTAGGGAVVTATDPISILPDLGLARAGKLALDIVLTDVAVSGIGPTHCTISLTLPLSMTDDEIATVWQGLSEHARDLGVGIVDAHVSRARSVDFSWVGSATAFGVGEQTSLIRPDGARPGDAILVATGPGAEVAGLVSHLYPDHLGLSETVLDTAQARLDDITGVRDARTAVAAGQVTAMHDATEGGIVGGLVEMASGGGVRFDIERSAVEVPPGVEPVCDVLGVDPWEVTSCGTLLCTVAPEDADAVVDALAGIGTPASIVGTVSDGSGVYVDGERVTPPETDPSWEAIERLQRDDH